MEDLVKREGKRKAGHYDSRLHKEQGKGRARCMDRRIVNVLQRMLKEWRGEAVKRKR